jgi:hypothetical protein
MRIEYELTREDLFAFQWRAAYLSADSQRLRRRSYAYLFIAFLLIAVLPMIGSGGMRAARLSLLFLLTVFPVVAALYWAIQRRMLRRAIHALIAKERPGKGQLGRHTLVLDDSGVFETTGVGETRTSWTGVDRIEQDRDYIFIYTTPAAAHVIPKRVFTEEKADEFYAAAVRRKDGDSLRVRPVT